MIKYNRKKFELFQLFLAVILSLGYTFPKIGNIINYSKQDIYFEKFLFVSLLFLLIFLLYKYVIYKKFHRIVSYLTLFPAIWISLSPLSLMFKILISVGFFILLYLLFYKHNTSSEVKSLTNANKTKESANTISKNSKKKGITYSAGTLFAFNMILWGLLALYSIGFLSASVMVREGASTPYFEYLELMHKLYLRYWYGYEYPLIFFFALALYIHKKKSKRNNIPYIWISLIPYTPIIVPELVRTIFSITKWIFIK